MAKEFEGLKRCLKSLSILLPREKQGRIQALTQYCRLVCV